MQNQERSKMLGSMPMGKLVPKVSVPIMISMLVQALYNVVDGIFVARYSADAFTAVSLVFPIQMLMIAVGAGLGVGINSLVSRRLGAGQAEGARSAARNGIFLELCGALLFCLFGLFFARSFLRLFTDDADLQLMGGSYLTIVTVFSFGLLLSMVFERLMQATGNTVLSMTTQLAGAVTNIILDPIMIFVMKMGVAGAAWATVIGQMVGM
ncbi:MAG: polysaccharide biosynthesis C-terminal domain-containing protein, partial [Clostridia bacterium]|nr:polysaccharide biosynthesis C-terminal domain-containing protein [Clostridia bacterium]